VRATLHQSITNSMQELHIKLLLGLDRHKAHVLLGHGTSDRLRIDEVVLVRIAVNLYELGRDESYFVSLLSQRGSHKVRPGTHLKANQRGRQIRRMRQQLCAGKLLTKENLAMFCQCN